MHGLRSALWWLLRLFVRVECNLHYFKYEMPIIPNGYCIPPGQEDQTLLSRSPSSSCRLSSSQSDPKHLLLCVLPIILIPHPSSLTTPLRRYFLSDNTISIEEPRITNSGLTQGKFMRRLQVTRPLNASSRDARSAGGSATPVRATGGGGEGEGGVIGAHEGAETGSGELLFFVLSAIGDSFSLL